MDWDLSADELRREHFSLSEQAHYFYWPILGKARVELSGRVTIEAHSEAPAGIIPHALCGPIAAHWALLSGNIPLHANCVAVDGQLLSLVGHSGAGKSSLAAALIAHGCLPHGDDIISIRPGSGTVPFGTARVKLNPDILERLSLPALSVAPVYAGLAKRSVQFAFPSDLSPLPLRAIYKLCDAVRPGPPHIEEVEGFPAAMAIVSEVYRPRVSVDAFGLESMLGRCASLVGKVRMFKLHRSRDLAQIEKLAGCVVDHFRTLTR